MSLCNEKEFSSNITLSTHANHTNLFILRNCKEIPLCACKLRASLTVEAAIVFSFVTAFFISILFFFRIMQVQTDMQVALGYATRRAATAATKTDSEEVLLLLAKGYWRKGLSNKERVSEYIDGGLAGVRFAESKASGEYVELVANYSMTVPFSFFPSLGIKVTQAQKSKKWTGDEGWTMDQNDPYVYVTKNGTAYHLNKECSYLKLSMQRKGIKEISDMRNKDGEKYYPCEECAENIGDLSVAYIADYGTRYHASMECNAIKRHIYMMHLSEVEGRSCCSKCGGGRG